MSAGPRKIVQIRPGFYFERLESGRFELHVRGQVGEWTLELSADDARELAAAIERCIR